LAKKQFSAATGARMRGGQFRTFLLAGAGKEFNGIKGIVLAEFATQDADEGRDRINSGMAQSKVDPHALKQETSILREGGRG